MAVGAIKSFIGDYREFLPVVDRALNIAEDTQQQTYKPGLLSLKAKYYLHAKKENNKAVEYYDEAILFAKILGDGVLEQGLIKEKQQDGL